MTAFHTTVIPLDDILKWRMPMYILEIKLLDGFLIGRGRVRQEVEKSAEQGKLL